MFQGYLAISLIQESYTTPRYRTPQPIPLENYARNPGLKSLLVMVARGVFLSGVLKQP